MIQLEDVSNFSAGFGDAFTFGLTGAIRQAMDVDDVVNPCSGSYLGGEVTGIAFQIPLMPEAEAAEAGEVAAEAELLESAAACFVAGTPVLTKDGQEPIDQVEQGDKIWSRDPNTGEFGWKKVTDTIVHFDKPVLRLELVDGQGHSDVVGVTGNHPFWVLDTGWTEADDLADGDEIFSSRGGWVKVGSASWLSHTQTVYNLEVNEFHTYFVGQSGAWVHNTCGKPYVVQTGGNTISNRTARVLNEELGMNLHKREWGRAVESIKSHAGGMRNDVHGKIWSNGNYTDVAGNLIDNLMSHL